MEHSSIHRIAKLGMHR